MQDLPYGTSLTFAVSGSATRAGGALMSFAEDG